MPIFRALTLESGPLDGTVVRQKYFCQSELVNWFVEKFSLKTMYSLWGHPPLPSVVIRRGKLVNDVPTT